MATAGGDRPVRRGRAARSSAIANAAPTAVWPGLPGGTYRPLAVSDIERIHRTALDVLAEIGVADPIPEILHYALPRGCTVGPDGRLRFPRDLVEELIGVASCSYVRYGVDPALDQELSGERVYFATSGEAVSILDYDTQSFRPDATRRPVRRGTDSSTVWSTSTATASRSSPPSTAATSTSTT